MDFLTAGLATSGGWGERWFNWRNRLLASPLFQRRAAAFLLTRPLAQRRARELFDLVAGFVYSQCLLACVRLDLFTLLSAGPLGLPALSERTGLEPPALQRLLDAAVALRLLERRDGERWGLGVLGAPLVHNHAVLAMVEHHATLYADLADPLALLRGERRDAGHLPLHDYFPYARAAEPQHLRGEQVAAYSALMSASQPLVADEILDHYPVARHRMVLDIGGGEGTFLLRVAQRAPQLKLALFDLPAVARRARERFSQAGLSARATAHGGNFKRDRLPRGADLATLVRVAHDHDDDTVLTVMRAAWEALDPGGALLLAEPMAGTAGAQAMGDAYFGFYLLAMGSGRPRTASQLAALMQEAGFVGLRLVPTRLPVQVRLLIGRKPKRSGM